MITHKAVLIGDLNMLRSFTNNIPTLFLTDKEEGLKSRFCNEYCFLRKDDNILDLLRVIGKREDKPTLFYGADAHLMMISRNRKELSHYFNFLMPSEEITEACTDKILFGKLAGEKNLPIPKQVSSDELSSYKEIVGKIDFPVIIKPAFHVGWHNSAATEHLDAPAKILVSNNLEEFRFNYETTHRFTDNFVVQEYIRGGEDSIYSFHTFIDEKGMLLSYYMGKKIRTYPSVGGESSYIELIDRDSELLDLSLDIIEKLKVRGPVKIDFKKDSVTGKFYLLELNLRFNLWNHLGSAAGVNLPMLAYHYLSGTTGSIKPNNDYKVGMKWLAFGMDFRAFVKYYRHEGMSVIEYVRSLFAPKVYDVFAWNDPYPFVYWVTMKVGRKVKRILGR